MPKKVKIEKVKEEPRDLNIEFCGAKILENSCDIPLAAISDDLFNTRGITPQSPGIRDLADNIARLGQLVPVIVMHDSVDDRFMLIAGHRRLAALRLSGALTIRGIVVSATTEQAEMIALTENLKRENLSPLQEAAAIKKLLDTGMDRKTAAAVLGWPESKVARRARLLNLAPEWWESIQNKIPKGFVEKGYFINDNLFNNWSVQHLELIASYDQEMQLDLLQDLVDNLDGEELALMTVEDLQEWLLNKSRLLKKVPWKLDDEALLSEAGACDSCSKRSSHRPGLFDGDMAVEKIPEGDRCLDASCFQKKMEAHAKRKEEERRSKNPDLIKITEGYNDKDGLLGSCNYDIVKKNTPGSKEALVGDGQNIGQIKWIKVRRQATGKTAARPKGADGKPKPASKKERYAKLEHRRNAHIVGAIRELLSAKNPGKKYRILPACDNLDRLKYHLALAASFGTRHCQGSFYTDRKVWSNLAEFHRGEDEPLFCNIVEQVVPVLNDRLIFQTGDEATKKIDEARSICSLLGIDFDELQGKAIRAIPVPKSWAKLDNPGKSKADRRKEDSESGFCSLCAKKSKHIIEDESGLMLCRHCYNSHKKPAAAETKPIERKDILSGGAGDGSEEIQEDERRGRPSQEEILSELRLAVNGYAGSEEKWEKRKEEGLTDKELREVLCDEFGEWRNSGGPGHRGHTTSGTSGKPRFYMGMIGINPKTKPTLQGKELIDTVRKMLEIPYPQTKGSSSSKNVKAAAKKIGDQADKAFAESQGPSCKYCGCTEQNACLLEDGPCYWVKPNVCSNPECIAKDAKAERKAAKNPSVKLNRKVRRKSVLK